MSQLRAKAKTGGRFEYELSLTDPVDIAAEYPDHGLIGLTAVARVVDERGETLHDFPMQVLTAGQPSVTFVCGGSVTEGWVVGETARMDILFSNGIDEGKVLTPTIVIKINEGITQVGRAVGTEKVFSPPAFDTGYKTQASAS